MTMYSDTYTCPAPYVLRTYTYTLIVSFSLKDKENKICKPVCHTSFLLFLTTRVILPQY